MYISTFLFTYRRLWEIIYYMYFHLFRFSANISLLLLYKRIIAIVPDRTCNFFTHYYQSHICSLRCMCVCISKMCMYAIMCLCSFNTYMFVCLLRVIKFLRFHVQIVCYIMSLLLCPDCVFYNIFVAISRLCVI